MLTNYQLRSDSIIYQALSQPDLSSFYRNIDVHERKYPRTPHLDIRSLTVHTKPRLRTSSFSSLSDTDQI